MGLRASTLGRIGLVVLAAGGGCAATAERGTAGAPRNFVYFGLDRERIAEPGFLQSAALAGAQLKYRWQELEPERDRYDLAPILRDLAFLERHGKKLFVQLQDVSFEEAIVNVPAYLLSDSSFGGGVARQYAFEGDDESRPSAQGWVARRWDPAVRARLVALLEVLGGELDGRIEGLNLPETAVEFGESGALHPPGFTFAGYAESVGLVLAAARRALPRSVVIQYANFMPGEWLPDSDHGYLRGVYELAERIGAGVGGPDLLPHRRWQRIHSYALIAARDPRTVAGVAVQRGNLEEVDPATGERVTVEELYGFARHDLRLDYLFWGTQEPYYSRDVLPFLEHLAAGTAPSADAVAAER